MTRHLRKRLIRQNATLLVENAQLKQDAQHTRGILEILVDLPSNKIVHAWIWKLLGRDK